MRQFFAYLMVITWITTACTFGIQGIVLLNFKQQLNDAEDTPALKTPIKVDGILFEHKAEIKVYKNIKDLHGFFVFKSLVTYPAFLLLILTACAFGMLGSSVLIVKKVVLDKIPIEEINVWLLPLLGLMVGVIVLGIADLVPTLLVEGKESIRPITLVFMAFFAGLFVERFYAWVEANFKVIFKD